MLLLIIANHFNINISAVVPHGDFLPFPTGQNYRITRVGNNIMPYVQIVARYSVRKAIALSLNLDAAYLTQGLLYGVDPQIGRSVLFC